MKKLLQLFALAALLTQTLFAIDPIYDAIKRNDLDKVARLIAEDPSCANARDSDDWTPLHYAAANGRTEVAKLLIHNRADLGAHNLNGYTPLQTAREYGYTDLADIVNLLTPK